MTFHQYLTLKWQLWLWDLKISAAILAILATLFVIAFAISLTTPKSK